MVSLGSIPGPAFLALGEFMPERAVLFPPDYLRVRLEPRCVGLFSLAHGAAFFAFAIAFAAATATLAAALGRR